MCTAIASRGAFPLFGRTLDLEKSYGEEAVLIPEDRRVDFLREPPSLCHGAILGVATVRRGIPLFYDGMNEAGLWVAALNFPGNEGYGGRGGGIRLASFEVIPWLLCHCTDLGEAEESLRRIRITDEGFSAELPPTPLHWMICHGGGSLVAEPFEGRLKVYENPFGVLTNSPPFPEHLRRLADAMGVSPSPAENRICPDAALSHYSRGMGGIGLPGDFSSCSRLIRAVFANTHTGHGSDCAAEVNRFFRVADTVSVPDGCVLTEEGAPVRTVYTCCASPTEGCYYVSTYERRTPCVFTVDGLRATERMPLCP